MISQYNSEMQSLNFTVQKTNQSLKTYIDSVIVERNGQALNGQNYVLNVEDYTLEPQEINDAPTDMTQVGEDGSNT